MPIDIPDFRRLIWILYKATAELEIMFPGRPFPIDGELADRVAESMAECLYGVQLLPTEESAEPQADLLVKAAQRGRIWLQRLPRHLLVLRIYKNGTSDEVYNGPGELVWKAVQAEGNAARAGGRTVPLTLLRGLMRDVPRSERLPRLMCADGGTPLA